MFIIRLAAEAVSVADSHSNRHSLHSSDVAYALPLTTSTPPDPGNNFLYNLLSGTEDASSAQSRSQLYSQETFPSSSSKPRSNSVYVLPTPSFSSNGASPRPSSVPEITPVIPQHPEQVEIGGGQLSYKQLDPRHSHSHHLHLNNTHSNLHRRHHPYNGSNVLHRSNGSCGDMSPARSVSTDSGVDEPLNLTKHIASLASPFNFLPSNTQTTAQQVLVQLAKKTVYPVQAHITEWLREMTSLAAGKSPAKLDRLCQLQPDVRLRLLQCSWHRVLALYMAESNFRVVTSICQTTESVSTNGNAGGGGGRATQHFVDQLEEFIDLCSLLPLESSAYDLLRIAVILMGQEASVDAHKMELLEGYLTKTQVSPLRIRELMYKLFQLDQTEMRNLFCGHFPNPVEYVITTYFVKS